MALAVHVEESEARELDGVAERFFAAVEKGDINTVRDTYAPDARIWHNFDNYASTREENLGILRWVSRHIENFRFEEVRRSFVPGAFFQQHVMHGRDEQGNEITCPSILKVEVKDGHIVRIEEYFETAQMPELGFEEE